MRARSFDKMMFLYENNLSRCTDVALLEAARSAQFEVCY